MLEIPLLTFSTLFVGGWRCRPKRGLLTWRQRARVKILPACGRQTHCNTKTARINSVLIYSATFSHLTYLEVSKDASHHGEKAGQGTCIAILNRPTQEMFKRAVMKTDDMVIDVGNEAILATVVDACWT